MDAERGESAVSFAFVLEVSAGAPYAGFSVWVRKLPRQAVGAPFRAAEVEHLASAGAALFHGVGNGAVFALPLIVRSGIHFALGVWENVQFLHPTPRWNRSATHFSSPKSGKFRPSLVI